MRIKLSLFAGAIGMLVGVAIAKQPGPVIENLGPVVPTPAPSPKREEHLRLISAFTVNNRPNGESVISFEATDYGASAVGDEQKFRTIASEQYSLIEPKPEARDLRDQIMRKIRDLESDLLRYVDITGPPRVREPIMQQSGGAPPR